MSRKRNPAPGATGNGAGINAQYQLAIDIRPHLKAQELCRLRRLRHVEQIHRLGARVLFELVDELDRHHGLGDDLDRRLQRYAGLDPEVLCALGGDQLPVSPVRIVGGAA
jgi:hypothetical protein